MGAISGWLNDSLTLRCMSVMPAPLLNSAADRVVGTAVMRMARSVACTASGASPRLVASRDNACMSSTPRHSASNMVLVASTTEPPPTASKWSAPTSRASAAPAITASRGECAAMADKWPAQRSPSAEVTSRINRLLTSDCVVSSSTRLAPTRSISTGTASATGLPCITRSCVVHCTAPVSMVPPVAKKLAVAGVGCPNRKCQASSRRR